MNSYKTNRADSAFLTLQLKICQTFKHAVYTQLFFKWFVLTFNLWQAFVPAGILNNYRTFLKIHYLTLHGTSETFWTVLWILISIGEVELQAVPTEEAQAYVLVWCVSLIPALQRWFPPAGREVLPATERGMKRILVWCSCVFTNIYYVTYLLQPPFLKMKKLFSHIKHYIQCPVIGNGLRTSSGRLMNNTPLCERNVEKKWDSESDRLVPF